VSPGSYRDHLSVLCSAIAKWHYLFAASYLVVQAEDIVGRKLFYPQDVHAGQGGHCGYCSIELQNDEVKTGSSKKIIGIFFPSSCFTGSY
jgi:hypothetical protein